MERCDRVETNSGPRIHCTARAEFSVTTLDDGLLACDEHLTWAQQRLGPDILRVDLLHPDDWPSGFPGLWTTTQAARHWGVKPGTYRDYVSAGYAPQPVEMRDPRTGAKLYRAVDVREWHANRLGQGARTDLIK